jgi:uncharacterized protein YfaS (alpha-2-macroglobulin family)
VTYPNVLVMGYLRETGQLTPESKMKLEAALDAGYQRLLTFEAPGGGFGWYGGHSVRTLLTAYGVLMLSDMEKVHGVDRAVIGRARAALGNVQKSDGSWELDAPIHTWYQQGRGVVPTTAYVLWSLKEAGYRDSGVEKAEQWLRLHQGEATDPYVRALIALALGDAALVERDARIEGDEARWVAAGEGLYHSRGGMATVEATALAALALLRDGRSPLIEKALTAIARSKDPSGSWYSTQATILSIKALLEASKGAASPAKPAPLRLKVNGVDVQGLRPLSPENHDVVQQVEIPVVKGLNTIEVSVENWGRAGFQVFGRYYLPWNTVPEPAKQPLSISTVYERTALTLQDTLRARTTLRYDGQGTFMVIVDLGIPPGFVPDTGTFEEWVRNRTIDKYTVAGRHVTLYFGRVESGKPIVLDYTLRPRFPIVAKTPRCRAYEYYSPQVEVGGRPEVLKVTE